MKAPSLTLIAVLIGISAPARADEPEEAPQVLRAPSHCLQFWSTPTGDSRAAAWDAVLSFAACIQDRSVGHVERAEELEGFVAQLHAALEPSLRLYVSAVNEGPGPIQLRAAYAIGLGQVALMTRARASLASPELRAQLEPLLAPHAELAYVLFTTIDEAVAQDESLAPDVVSRYMVGSARAHAASLRFNRR